MPPKKVRIGPLRKGTLTQFGYSLYGAPSQRHAALDAAVNFFGYATIIKKLNAIRVLNKNKHPDSSAVYTSDMHYVQRRYEH